MESFDVQCPVTGEPIGKAHSHATAKTVILVKYPDRSAYLDGVSLCYDATAAGKCVQPFWQAHGSRRLYEDFQ